VVSTHEDVTEREKLNAELERQHLLVKQQEERLRVQNLQLDAALNNMVQGLAMFDADLRVVLVNNRYAEIEAGSVLLEDSKVEELKGAFEGMRLKQTRVPLKRKNENNVDITGLYAVKLQVAWKADGQEQAKELTFYVYPRQR